MICKKNSTKISGCLIVLLLILITFGGCCSPHYDAGSFLNFGEIRGRMLVLYDILQVNLDEVQINDVRNSLLHNQSYENARSCNDETKKLSDSLLTMFDRHIMERRAGNWTPVIKSNNQKDVNTLIMHIIKLEEAKSK